ncbi:MAG: ASKHA domain-containing protein [Candidatus Brocadiia bacterium]|jgi:uncharacterized 2Fe-2S/4Fe-4S cluster protein (DUF4445 family)|nr:ASKHA domain-containing protein [Candidatus Brocadiia bacterium]
MSNEAFRVTFQPEGRSVFVLPGTKLIEAAGQAGIILNTPCGGEGSCGKCRVEIYENPPPPSQACNRLLSEEEIASGLRLSCQLAVERDLVVSVPESARMFDQVVLTEGKEHAISFDPPVRKVCMELPESSIEDLCSDVDRLKDALRAENGEVGVDAARIRELAPLLRSDDSKLTAVLSGKAVMALEKGDTTGAVWGIAFDVGTTTVVGTLVDLETGRRAGVASRTNPQLSFGDDVVSRIYYTEQHEHGLQELQTRIVACLNDIILELAGAAHVDMDRIYEATAVGNSTMAHLLLGIDPSSIAHAPYASVYRQGIDTRADSVGLDLNANANLHVLPNIAGFVGSDTVGVILAARLMHRDEVCIAIDIGTNGEMAIGNRERLVTCSTAAGPAFEGARIRQGMRAAEGAISKVLIGEKVQVSVVGGGRASGICGSGLIDAVAEFLHAGILDTTGRIRDPKELPASVPDPVRQAVTTLDGQPAVVLVDSHASKTGEPVLLTQRDIREVQLAKGAIWAGILVICDEFGVEPDKVHSILLAGGFGNFIRRSNAKRIGMLPDLPTQRMEFIGNAAAVGARMSLVSRACRAEAGEISERCEYVELANRLDFQQLFTEGMMFPED